MTISQSYYDMLSRIESSNNPLAKAATSSASGLFQFVQGSWISLGGSWGSDKTKAFGGLMPSVSEQQAMAAKLTEQNAKVLTAAGVGINNATLYAAHFLGAGTASDVLTSSPSESLSAILPPSVIAANSFLSGGTVQTFFDWLARKTGTTVSGGVAANGHSTFRR